MKEASRSAPYLVAGLVVGLPWAVITSSTRYYDQAFEATRLQGMYEGGYSAAYLVASLLTFAALARADGEAVPLTRRIVVVFFVGTLGLIGLMMLAALLGLEGSLLFSATVVTSVVLGGVGAAYQWYVYGAAAKADADGAATRGFTVGFAIAAVAAAGIVLSESFLGSNDAREGGSWYRDPRYQFVLTQSIVTVVVAGGWFFGPWPDRVVLLNFGVDDEGLVGVDPTQLMDDAYVVTHDQQQATPTGEELLDDAAAKRRLVLCLSTILVTLGGTLMVFPALVASARSVQPSGVESFVPSLFLLWALGDTAGRAVSGVVLGRLTDSLLLAVGLARFLTLIGFFELNRTTREATAFWAQSDDGARAFLLLQGLMNGAIFGEAAARAPKGSRTPKENGQKVGYAAGLALALGSVVSVGVSHVFL